MCQVKKSRPQADKEMMRRRTTIIVMKQVSFRTFAMRDAASAEDV